MKFKLLERTDSLLTTDDGSSSFRLGRLNPEDIAEIKGILRISKNPMVTIALYAMRHCMTELTIGGEPIENPAQLSYRNNPSDPVTEAGLAMMSAKIMEEVILDDEARKKLQSQRKISSPSEKSLSEKAATNAPSSGKG